MKILISLIFTICFSLTIWADLPPLGPDGQPVKEWKHTPYSKPNGTCMSGILLAIGIFLLGQRLIKKKELNLQINNPTFTLSE